MIGVQSSQNNLRVWEFQEASQKKWFSFVLVKDTIDKQTNKQTQAQTIIKIDKGKLMPSRLKFSHFKQYL